MPHDFEGRYLSGAELYGDDFSQDEIASWFADEAEGYASLGAAEHGDATTYGYHALNVRHGFSRLPARRQFRHALGIGSSYGGEFLPVVDRVEALSILEPSEMLRSTAIGRLRPRYSQPSSSGLMAYDDGSFDLVLALGVLHHIPNVTTVLNEIGRVTETDGYLVLREPIISMGDWRFARNDGVTPRERGIPRQLLQETIIRAGFTIEHAAPVIFPLTTRIGGILGQAAFNSRRLTLLDALLSRITSINYRYHAVTSWQKVRPTSLFVLARRN